MTKPFVKRWLTVVVSIAVLLVVMILVLKKVSLKFQEWREDGQYFTSKFYSLIFHFTLKYS